MSIMAVSQWSQVVPIIDLMASSNTHFRKLKDFIALQLPSGFPVKIGRLGAESAPVSCVGMTEC